MRKPLILASYTSDYYAGKPGVSLRKREGESCPFWQFLHFRECESLVRRARLKIPCERGRKSAAELQATIRVSERERLCFLLNFTSELKVVTFKQSSFDFLEERELEGQVGDFAVRSMPGSLLTLRHCTSVRQLFLVCLGAWRQLANKSPTFPERPVDEKSLGQSHSCPEPLQNHDCRARNNCCLPRAK